MEDELELEKSYREMAADLEAEAEALKWIEGTIGDVSDERGMNSLVHEAFLKGT